MTLSITKIELNSYAVLPAFFKFNGKIINELKQSTCKKYKISGEWNLKVWYTMTLWENEKELIEFYRKGVHLEAMKQSKAFSSRIQSVRLPQEELMNWQAAKKVFHKK